MSKISKKKKLVKSTVNSEKKGNKNIRAANPPKTYAIIFAIISLLIDFLFLPKRSEISEVGSNPFFFFLISLIGSAAIFIGLNWKNIEHYKNLIKYLFLLCLACLVLFFVAEEIFINDKTSFIWERITLYTSSLIAPLSLIGFMLVYLYKEQILDYIQLLFPFNKKEIPNNEVNSKEQSQHSTKRHQNFFTVGVLILIASISLFTIFYKLDGFDLFSDETQVTQGAAGYYHTGEFKQWSFIQQKTVGNTYDRAWPHLFLVAQSYKIFGITPWSSRFPSALFGIIFIISAFFIIKYFIKDHTVVILSTLSFCLYYNYLQLFRWARMYAIAIPVFLLAFYFGYRFLVEKNQLKLLPLKQIKFGHYLNFNYVYLLPFLILIYFSFHLHVNSLLALLILFVISIIYYFIKKEAKYLTAIITGIGFIILGYLALPNVGGIINYLSFFEQDNARIYSELMFAYPFSKSIGIVLFITGAGLLFFVNHQKFKQVYILLYSSIIITFVLFAYVFNYPASFRYVSFFAAISIVLIISVFILLLKATTPKFVQWTGYLMIILLITSHLYKNYDNLYVRNPLSPAYPSIAIKTIVKTYKKGELIYRHWGPGFYFQGIDKSVKLKGLGNYEGKKFNLIIDTLQKYPSGWLTWMSHNTFRMDPKLVNYANLYFTKYHGLGVDKTGVELFHYTDSMLVDSMKFNFERNLPHANLNLANTYSLAFWVKLDKANDHTPFIFTENEKKIFEIRQVNDNRPSLLFVYNNATKDSIEGVIPEANKWHHVCWFQEGGEVGDEIGLYVDGKRIITKQLTSPIKGLVKYKLNPEFKGERNDIRIYDFVLSQEQINLIMKNLNTPNSSVLKVKNTPFKTLFHWQKK